MPNHRGVDHGLILINIKPFQVILSLKLVNHEIIAKNLYSWLEFLRRFFGTLEVGPMPLLPSLSKYSLSSLSRSMKLIFSLYLLSVLSSLCSIIFIVPIVQAILCPSFGAGL
jgi:hypothetical protein